MELEDVAIEGRPTSKLSPNWKCPICGESFDHYKHPVTVFKLPKPETARGLIPKDYGIEVHCLCGFHYWFHSDLRTGVDKYILASCEKCIYGHEWEEASDEDLYMCDTDAMRHGLIEEEDYRKKPQCPLGRYYSIDDDLR